MSYDLHSRFQITVFNFVQLKGRYSGRYSSTCLTWYPGKYEELHEATKLELTCEHSVCSSEKATASVRMYRIFIIPSTVNNLYTASLQPKQAAELVQMCRIFWVFITPRAPFSCKSTGGKTIYHQDHPLLLHYSSCAYVLSCI